VSFVVVVPLSKTLRIWPALLLTITFVATIAFGFMATISDPTDKVTKYFLDVTDKGKLKVKALQTRCSY
jgi:hypothetical protein